MLESDDRIRNAYLQYAHELIKHFIMCCADLYGKTFPVYDVHGLLHLHEDASHFNCSLNDISCFPFENYLQQIKKHARSGSKRRSSSSFPPLAALEQVTRRLSEIEHSEVNESQIHPLLLSEKETVVFFGETSLGQLSSFMCTCASVTTSHIFVVRVHVALDF
ncbi:uncharacterized protein LOC120524551 [Scomber scombrus]|uniref:Uncharacterized protein LOC120524551 n=1 Tax=Scomber scombrus TaxID=13677 RepID=A0AAV1Q4J6_SCOSC